MASIAWNANAQKITATNEIIDCGSVTYNHPVTVKFDLQNSGYADLQIKNIKTSCGCTTVDFPKGKIAPGSAFTVSATYDARQLGHFIKDIGIYSNAGPKPYYLSIRGAVVEEIIDFSGTYPFEIAQVKADINNIEFDDVNRGERPVKKIHIMNKGTATISPVVMHLPSYLEATVSPTTISPGRQGVVTVTLDSKKLRDFGLTQTSIFLGMFPGDKVSPAKEISVSAVLLPAFTEMTETEYANAPQLRLSRENIDIHFKKSLKKTESITIENTGRSPLDIRSLQMFTTGLKVKLNKTKLMPNEKATLKITAEAKALKTARSKPRVLMITNDPDKSKVVININIH